MMTPNKAYSLIKNQLGDTIHVSEVYKDSMGYVFICEDYLSPDNPETPSFQVLPNGKVLPFTIPPLENIDRLEKARSIEFKEEF